MSDRAATNGPRLLQPLLGAALALALGTGCGDGAPAPTAPAQAGNDAAPTPTATARTVADTSTAPVPNGDATSPDMSAYARKNVSIEEQKARYSAGIEREDFGYDLSKVSVSGAGSGATPAQADDPHAGHDHGPGEHHADDDPARSTGLVQPGSTLKGRLSMAEGHEQVHDFGKLRQGYLGQHRFYFVSDGEEPLIVNTVKPSCGCTKAELVLVNDDGSEKDYVKGQEIPVGQRFYLDTEITTDGKPAGPFTAQVALYGNDPRGAFNVRMTAEIEAVLEVKPSPTAYLGRLTTADTAEQTVTVRSLSGERFLLDPNEKGVVEPLKVQLTPIEPDAEGRAAEWEIQLTLGPDIPVGMRYYPVVFKSDIPVPHPKYAPKEGEPPQTYAAQVNVQAHVVGMVHAEPNFVNFGIVRPGAPVERTLQLEVHDDFQLAADLPITIEGYQGQEFPFPDAFETTVHPSEDGRTASISLKLTGLPEDHSGSFGGILKVKVGHPHMEELQVRFSGVARRDLTRRQ